MIQDSNRIIVIQGTADATDKLTQAEFSKTIDYLTQAFIGPESERQKGAKSAPLSPQDREILDDIRKRHVHNICNVDSFTTDVIDNRVPRLQRGSLGLVALEA